MNKTKKPKKIEVVELFAGVGGFRLGLDRASNTGGSGFETIWNNQWEPSTKKQHASEVYISRFGIAGHSNIDISKVDVSKIPNHDLLVGGFPCQDYSVARTLSQAAGIAGKKGVLWWEIHRILNEKGKHSPSYLLLENVDRLLKSPAIQRGRDFAIMISSLNDLGYAVEWRVVNAAEYGMPQRRRRTFILGYKKNSPVYKKILQTSPDLWVGKLGIAATTFPFKPKPSSKTFTIQGSLVDITKNFNQNSGSVSPFLSAGISIGRDVFTTSVNPTYDGKKKTLGDIIISEENIPESYYISQKDLAKWKYLKGAKNKPMKSKSGFSFVYTEGSMVFPDPLDRPSRTIITAEGGSTPSRFKHVIKTESGRLRRLTPLELERLNMFPDNHTIGQSDTKRAFFMGNALVVGVVTKLGKTLLKHL